MIKKVENKKKTTTYESHGHLHLFYKWFYIMTTIQSNSYFHKINRLYSDQMHRPLKRHNRNNKQVNKCLKTVINIAKIIVYKDNISFSWNFRNYHTIPLLYIVFLYILFFFLSLSFAKFFFPLVWLSNLIRTQIYGKKCHTRYDLKDLRSIIRIPLIYYMTNKLHNLI